MVVTGPTTGQTLSSISLALGSSMMFFRAGHFCASAEEVPLGVASVGRGTEGCLERLEWWSVSIIWYQLVPSQNRTAAFVVLETSAG